jgi:hypothetical protein
MKLRVLLSLLSLSFLALPALAFDLKSGESILQLEQHGKSGFELRLNFQKSRFEQPSPLAVEVIETSGASRRVPGSYSHVKANKRSLNGEGEVISPNGTHFHFYDCYSPDADGFQLERRVEITTPSSLDSGFSTRFSIATVAPLNTHEADVLMPGLWYRDNKTVPPKAFASNIDNQLLMAREDRMGLPLVSFRERQNGTTLTLERVGGSPTTFLGDQGREQLINERMQTGAMGILNDGKLAAAFDFPGSDDERTSLGPDSQPSNRYEPRSHPVKAGGFHHYTLHLGIRKTASFAESVELTTKSAIERAHPLLLRADLPRVYRASQDLLDGVTQNFNGTVAVPFQVTVPGGEIKDTSTQMGFVGMALPCAALLLKDGLENDRPSAIERAEKVVDFWVEQAATPSGVPKSWADFPAPGKVKWRGYPTHLRVASDGMEGVLQAWKVARRFQRERPKWLQFAQSYGDFLVEHQNADGAWFGSWNIDGTARDRFTNATTHPIEFLVDLSKATGDSRYSEAAERAGGFCWSTVHQAYSYVGGTPDNPNVTDKEAGAMAVRAFMALFDATGSAKWLNAAKQAALFCETWIYWRDVPVPEGSERSVFPRGQSTVGLSIIATGHSSADNFMAVAPFWWYRIYLATGDAHFLRTARWLLHDTKQVMDWDGKLGYKYAGLMPEAMTLSTGRGSGVAGWLPWLTVVVLEPMRNLEETFGSFDIDVIEKTPLSKRRRQSAKFATSRGF